MVTEFRQVPNSVIAHEMIPATNAVLADARPTKTCSSYSREYFPSFSTDLITI